MQEKRIRNLRQQRRVPLVMGALVCVLLAAEMLAWRTVQGSVLAGIAVAVNLANVCRLSRRIASAERDLERDLRRPDYALIAEIEREVYGEAFHHDGAPEPSLYDRTRTSVLREQVPGMSMAELAEAIRKARASRQRESPPSVPDLLAPPVAVPQVIVLPPLDPLPQFWLKPGTTTAPPGCLCRWETRRDGYLVINAPSYHGNALPRPLRCPLQGHDPA